MIHCIYIFVTNNKILLCIDAVTLVNLDPVEIHDSAEFWWKTRNKRTDFDCTHLSNGNGLNGLSIG